MDGAAHGAAHGRQKGMGMPLQEPGFQNETALAQHDLPVFNL